MHILSWHFLSLYFLPWLDQRTMLAAQIPFAAVFALILLSARRAYPNPRGSNALAYGLLLSLPATLLLLASASLRPFGSIVLPCFFTIGAYILLYCGTASFLRSRGFIALLYDVAAVTAAVILYFTAVYDLTVPRLVAMSAFIALARAMMAVELYRSAERSTVSQIFAALFAAFAIVPLAVTILIVSSGNTSAAYAGSALQVPASLLTFSTITDLLFFSIVGLFGISMFLAEISAAIRQQGQLDPVTGTLNQHGIEDALTSEVARSSRTHSPVSVMMIEVDNFRAMVDTHGQPRSEDALRTVVKTIASILRFYDKCGRIAEDRFLLLLPENAAEHAMVIAGRFREALKNPNLPHDQPGITLSIGVTQCAFKEPCSEVVARAELALAEARRQGKNCAYLKLPNHDDVVVLHPDRIANRSRVAKLIR